MKTTREKKTMRGVILWLLPYLLLLFTAVAQADLVAVYTFDDGTANDSSGNDLHGQFQDGAQVISDSEQGEVLECNGTGWVQIVDDDLLDVTDAFTISFWFLHSGGRDFSYKYGSGNTWRIHTDNDATSGVIEFTVYGVSAGNLKLPTKGTDHDIDDGTWHHMVVGYDSVQGKSYVHIDGGTTVGGLSMENTSAGTVTVSTANVSIGAASTGGNAKLVGAIDDFRIYNNGFTPAEIPDLMNPLAGSGAVPLDPVVDEAIDDPHTFLWTFERDVVVDTYTLYMDTDKALVTNPDLPGQPMLIGAQAVSPVSAADPNASYAYTGAIENDTDYYWRVDAAVFEPNFAVPDPAFPIYDIPSTVEGATWHFTGPITVPGIITGPVAAVKFPGESVSFTCEFTSESAPTVDWLQDGVSYDAGTLVDNGGGNYTATLTISGIVVADEGNFACKVENSSGPANAATSAEAGLGVKRQVAYWQLSQADYLANAQYSDTSVDDADLNHAAPNGPAAFELGADGTANGALVIDPVADPNGWGWADAGTWNPSYLTGQLTVSTWVKWADQMTPATYQGIIAKRDTWNAGNMMWQIGISTANNCVFQRNGGGAINSESLPVGEWEHVVVSFDGTTATIYRNGEEAASGAFSLGTGTDAGLVFGRVQASSEPFNGSIDDVQLFNYAKDAKAVLDIYNANPAVADKALCLDAYDGTLDVAGAGGPGADCQVDLYDLVELTKIWLNCVSYPTAECN